MKLNHITNPDKNVQEKMRYFADYFSFVNEFLGRLPELPFDNHLSYTDKAIFQIENNFEYCPTYVISHLTQLFSYVNKNFEEPDAILNKIETQFSQLKAYPDKKEWLMLNKDFLKDLITLRNVYEASLFDNHFSALLTMLKCIHPLKKHKKQIQYSTQVIVSMYRLKGHIKESVKDYISRIISDNKFKFPFPPEFIKAKTKEEYDASTKHYLSNRDFDKQFEGLKTLFIADKHKSGYFFYVIDNCIIEDSIAKDFKITFDKVTFISTTHKDLKKLRSSIRNHDKENIHKTFPVFFGKNKMLAYVNMGYESKDSKRDEGLAIVIEELLSMNQYFESSLVVNSLHYMVYDSFETDLWSATTSMSKVKMTHISKFDMEEFSHNPYEYLRAVSSPAKHLILQNEKIFLKAFARNEAEDYWIFIENVFARLFNNNDKVRKGFVKILNKLTDDLRFEFLVQIGIMLTPYNFNCEEENLEQKDVLEIHEEIFTKHNQDFDISQYKGKVKSLLLKDIFEYHNEFSLPSHKDKWKRHFSSLLLELYGYRNSFVHSGAVNEYSQIKLVSILPKLISRARWKIIKACKAEQNLDYAELLKKLIK